MFLERKCASCREHLIRNVWHLASLLNYTFSRLRCISLPPKVLYQLTGKYNLQVMLLLFFFNLVRLEHFSGDRFQQQLLILLQIKLKSMSRLTSYICCCFRLGCCSMSDANRLLLPTPNKSENSFQSLLFYVSCLI